MKSPGYVWGAYGCFVVTGQQASRAIDRIAAAVDYSACYEVFRTRNIAPAARDWVAAALKELK